MTELVPVRTIDAVRVTRPDGSVVESARVVEWAAQTSPGSPVLPPGQPGVRGYDPGRDSPVAGGALRLVGSEPARQALPPGPPAPARAVGSPVLAGAPLTVLVAAALLVLVVGGVAGGSAALVLAVVLGGAAWLKGRPR